MIQHSMNWDDLKYFLAVSRTGSIRAAAASLGVNHATVSRRINQFETAVGIRLFERSAQGYVRTTAADQIYAEAHHLEERLNTFSRRLLSHEDDYAGEIRVTVPQLLCEGFLMAGFAAFGAKYPQVEFEILESAELFNLANRDADVAFRICDTPPDHLIGKKVATMHRSCYITKKFEQNCQDPNWLAQQNWLGWSDNMRRPIGKIAREYPRFDSKHKIMSGSLQVKACELGFGIAVLPCFLGDPNPNLVRIPPFITEAKYDLWILLHPDLKKNTKLLQFMRFMTQYVLDQRAFLAGDLQHQ